MSRQSARPSVICFHHSRVVGIYQRGYKSVLLTLLLCSLGALSNSFQDRGIYLPLADLAPFSSRFLVHVFYLCVSLFSADCEVYLTHSPALFSIHLCIYSSEIAFFARSTARILSKFPVFTSEWA